MSGSPKKSPQRRSKRRSSFAASRINILSRGTAGAELYKDIDIKKSPEERMIMLTKACLEYTLKKMGEDTSGCRDFETYKREVEEAVLRKIADMEVTGVFKEATEKERTVPNPINMEMDFAIKDLMAKISSLQEESAKWEALITDTETKKSEGEQETLEITEFNISDSIKVQSAQYLCQRLDYSSLLAGLEQTCKKTNLMVFEHAKVIEKINKAFHHASLTIGKHMEEMKELQKPVETPRRVIQSLLSFPTPR